MRENFRHALEVIATLHNPQIDYFGVSKLPLVLWGASTYAEYMKSLLDIHEITIDSVVVDASFWRPGQFFSNIPVSRWEDVLRKHPKVDVVIAFDGSGKYRGKMAELQTLPEVGQCMRFSYNSVFFEFRSGFMTKNHAVLEMLFHRLSDDLSRHVLLAFLRASNLSDAEEFAQLNVPDETQYFPDFLTLTASEVFVDCGAFDGDTIAQFCERTQGKYKKIYAFECDPHNAGKLRENMSRIEKIGGGDVILLEKGVFSSPGHLFFDAKANTDSHIDESGGVSIEVDSIDHVTQGEDVSFIKMDIEGSELEALRGAQNTIRQHKPKLAVCVYHRQEDLVTIPQYILSLREDYRLYLRHYGNFLAETVLYAV
jgi:FkbM family methyltransferase